jgi:uncharacterized membrane protein YeaQ/YmgE (transglycosylase-associated protein family)
MLNTAVQNGHGGRFSAGFEDWRSQMTAYLANHSWLGWIVVGFLAGAAARLVTPGRGPSGCIVTILLGVAGALVAGWLGERIGWYRPGEAVGGFAAFVGAVLILIVYRAIAGRR